MSSDQDGPSGPADEQQTRLLDSLRAARGAPVSFDELRSIGIENPATLCYELEAAGMPITRVRRSDSNSKTNKADLAWLAARLEEPGARQPSTRQRRPAPPTGWRRWRTPGGMTVPRLRSQLLSTAHSMWPITLAGMLVLAAAAAALTAIALTRRDATYSTVKSSARGQIFPRGSHSPHIKASANGHSSALSERVATVTQPPTSEDTAATSPAGNASTAESAAGPGAGSDSRPRQSQSASSTPMQLQLGGHQLLVEGRYQAAIDDLRAAIGATGQSAVSCTQPVSETCLAYAYALYDLGRALRIDGDVSAAVPVLDERLRIDNQRPAVAHQLDLALTQLKSPPHVPPQPGYRQHSMGFHGRSHQPKDLPHRSAHMHGRKS